MITDPLAAWRGNPFFVLELPVTASRAEIERTGQRLLALLAVGSVGAGYCDTPLGPATRDADSVRQALATLRIPNERLIHELWAAVAPEPAHRQDARRGNTWTAAEHALGWAGQWPR